MNESGEDQFEQSEIGRNNQIPEISLVNIDESQIPPNKEGIPIAKELEGYRKLAQHTWERQFKAREKLKQKDQETYVSPRRTDQSLDWQKVWKLLNIAVLKRKEVFPDSEDMSMTDQEIITSLDNYLSKHDIGGDRTVGLAPDEFPEVIDKDIRKLCLEINHDSWIKTKDGCSGHRDVIGADGKTELSQDGFGNPYLAFVLDKMDTKSFQFIEKINIVLKEFEDKYLFIKTNAVEFPLGNKNAEKEDLLGYNISLKISSSQSWEERTKIEQGEDYFNDVSLDRGESVSKIVTEKIPKPEDLDREDDFINMYARSMQRQNYQRKLYQAYEKRYYDKYGDFFRSQEAEGIAQEFFSSIGKVIREVSNE